MTAFEKVTDGFDSLAVTPGGFMPLRRPDGRPFAPSVPSSAGGAAGELTEPPPFSSSPLRDVDREGMSALFIIVRYSSDAPDTRWTFPRGDHWIGVDHATTYRGQTWI